ncbi:MAG: ComEC/Rec2 family competence protein [Chloroflexota bacterium]|nr:MAG: ComEC/Rec2 family competence protein [Chloroflexota bacterium]
MPLFWLSLAFLAGIIFSAGVPLPTSLWLVVAGISLVLFFAYSWRQRRSTVSLPGFNSAQPRQLQIHLLLPALFALGAARFLGSAPDLNSEAFIAYHNDTGEEMKLVGRLTKPPQSLEGQTRLRMGVEGIQLENQSSFQPVRGTVEVRLSTAENWRYGDRVMVRGDLESPPQFEGFSYRDYLAQQGVYSYLRNARGYRLSSHGGNVFLRWIYAYKDHARRTLYRLWPDPEASLLAGILLGDESGIPEDVDQAFKDTGTTHIIVISGFNITIIAGLLVAVFSRVFGRGQFGVRRAAVIALTGVAVYTILVGADAAVVRAAIMGGMAVFASLVGRRQAGINTLAFVAALMAAFNPQVLWNVGFQLSFAATLGLVLYAEPLKAAFEKHAARIVAVETAQRWSRPVGEYFLYTLAAQLLVLPIIVYHFQRISLSALVANPLILPAQPPAMILGGLALLAGTVYFPLGQVLAWIAWPFMAFTIRAVEWLATIPGGVFNLGEVSAILVICFYGLVFGLTFAGTRSRKAAAWIRPGTVLGGLIVVTVLLWRSALAAPDDRLHMTLLDVGTGDAILIQSPSGRTILVDGGPSTRSLSDALGRRLPIGDRQLDWLVVAATAEGQIAGLAANLERFPPDNVLWAGPEQGSYPIRALKEKMTGMDIPVVSADAGQVLDLGEGARLQVLAVSRRGAVLLLQWKSFRVLLPVGADFETLDDLRTHPDLRGLTALLLAESGYAPVNPPDWIEHLAPRIALLSVAAGDLQGLPSPETEAALQGYNLLRTDRNGWIGLTTDGEQVWVEVERK